MKTKFFEKLDEIRSSIVGFIIYLLLLLLGLSIKAETAFYYFRNDIPENQENATVLKCNELASLEDFDRGSPIITNP